MSVIVAAMNIGFDGKRAVFNFTGLGNYSRTLVRSLATYFGENRYVLYTPGYRHDPRLDFVRERGNIVVTTPRSAAARVLPSLWRSFTVTGELAKDDIDVFHGLSNELPFRIDRTGIKSVVTIHDLIFLRYPELYRFLDRKIYYAKARHACRVADRIVAVSEQTKQDVVAFLNADSNKVEVVYQSCDPIFYERVDDEQKRDVRSRFDLPSEYLLFVGTVEKRKNLLALLKALKGLQGTLDLHLVVIGGGGSYRQQMIRYVQTGKLNGRVVFLKHVPFIDLPAIYQMASAFVYPSLFEGFGLPISEALWSRVPVVTSGGSCFAEAGGPSTLYVSPASSDELADGVRRVLEDSDLRRKMVEDGYSYVQSFHERKTAERMMAVYRGVAAAR